jgi:dihydroxyacid dehydratase/phosphogluconate dehydratase
VIPEQKETINMQFLKLDTNKIAARYNNSYRDIISLNLKENTVTLQVKDEVKEIDLASGEVVISLMYDGVTFPVEGIDATTIKPSWVK